MTLCPSVGYVVLAHGHPLAPARLLHRLAPTARGIVVHYDRAAGPDAFAQLQRAVAGLDVRFVPRRRCHWGGWSLVDATLAGTRSLLDSAAPDCVALISGTHYPLGNDRLRRLLASAPGCQFLDTLPMPRAGYPGDGGLDRVRTLHPFEGTKWFALRASGLARRVQRQVSYERSLPSDAVPHVGSQWWVLTAACLADMLESPSLPAYERFFRRSWIPDESFFHTWVANSPYAASVRSDPVVYTRWAGGSGPAVLVMADLPALRGSAAPFARKVDPEVSRALMDALDDEAHE